MEWEKKEKGNLWLSLENEGSWGSKSEDGNDECGGDNEASAKILGDGWKEPCKLFLLVNDPSQVTLKLKK